MYVCMFRVLLCMYVCMHACMYACTGTAPELLFKPCVFDSSDDSSSSSCFAYSVGGRTFQHDPIIRLEKKTQGDVTVTTDHHSPSPSSSSFSIVANTMSRSDNRRSVNETVNA